MNLTLTRPAATLSHWMGEGLGVRALFQWKFMAPILVHIVCRSKLSMNRGGQSLTGNSATRRDGDALIRRTNGRAGKARAPR
jgi:hypothetical protein